MAVDTERKRWSMLQWAVGPSYYPHVFNPDTSGLDSIERATVLKLYGGIPFAGVAGSVTLTGTAVEGGVTPEEIAAGGQTTILTISGDTWISSGFDDVRQDFIDCLVGASAHPQAWNVQISSALSVGDVVRTSDTVVTITLPAAAFYNQEDTVTVCVPEDATTSGLEPSVTPETFDILFAPTAPPGGGRGAKGGACRYPRRVLIDGVVHWVKSAAEERRLLEAYRARLEREALTLALEEAPKAKVAKARMKVVRAQRRVESVDTREEEWLDRLREEDEIILCTIH